MRKQLTAFLAELGTLGFVHGTTAEMTYTSRKGTVATISIFFLGRDFKVVCKAQGGHREHASFPELTVDNIRPLLPHWLKKELDGLD